MSVPIIIDDDATRWFDEEFASTVKPAREPRPTDLESYLDGLEHQALVASFRKRGSGQRNDAVAELPLGGRSDGER